MEASSSKEQVEGRGRSERRCSSSFSTDYLLVTQFITHLISRLLPSLGSYSYIILLCKHLRAVFCVDIKFCAYLIKYQECNCWNTR